MLGADLLRKLVEWWRAWQSVAASKLSFDSRGIERVIVITKFGNGDADHAAYIFPISDFRRFMKIDNDGIMYLNRYELHEWQMRIFGKDRIIYKSAKFAIQSLIENDMATNLDLYSTKLCDIAVHGWDSTGPKRLSGTVIVCSKEVSKDINCPSAIIDGDPFRVSEVLAAWDKFQVDLSSRDSK